MPFAEKFANYLVFRNFFIKIYSKIIQLKSPFYPYKFNYLQKQFLHYSLYFKHHVIYHKNVTVDLYNKSLFQVFIFLISSKQFNGKNKKKRKNLQLFSLFLNL